MVAEIANSGSQKIIPCVDDNRSMECPMLVKTEVVGTWPIFDPPSPNFHRRILGGPRNTLSIGVAENLVANMVTGGL